MDTRLAFTLALALAGCGPRGSGAEGSASATASSSAATSAKPSVTTSSSPSRVASASARASATASASAAAGSGEIDLDALLSADDSEAAKIGGVSVEPVDTSKVPSLGGAEKKTDVGDAAFLPLPGNVLEIANPTDWQRKLSADGDTGYLMSPDKSAFVLFTTFASRDEVAAKTDKTLALVKMENGAWKARYALKVGPDALDGVLVLGDAKVSSGNAQLALLGIETNLPKKCLAILVYENTAPAEVKKKAVAIFGSIRKKR